MEWFALLFLLASAVATNTKVVVGFISPHSDELNYGIILIDKGPIANFSSSLMSSDSAHTFMYPRVV